MLGVDVLQTLGDHVGDGFRRPGRLNALQRRRLGGALLSHHRLTFPLEVGKGIPISIHLEQSGPDELVYGLCPSLVSSLPSINVGFKFLDFHVKSLHPI